MKAPDTAQLMQMLIVLLKALGTRLLAIMALLMTCALFGWSMWKSTWLAFAVAAAFGAGVLWPVLFVGFYRGESSGDPV